MKYLYVVGCIAACAAVITMIVLAMRLYSTVQMLGG